MSKAIPFLRRFFHDSFILIARIVHMFLRYRISVRRICVHLQWYCSDWKSGDAVVAGEEKAGMAYVYTVPGRGIVDVILV